MDVFLLADIMENFLEVSYKTYGLCPTWSYTLPGYAW